MSEKYYLIDADSETHQKIAEALATRKRAIKARRAFVRREFGTNWNIGFGWSPRDWSVVLPEGTAMPPDWKYIGRDKKYIQPRASKRGRQLTAEMRGDEYFCPGAGAIGASIGCSSVFASNATTGFSLRSIGLTETSDGRFVVAVCQGMKTPPHSKRISDIEYEAITQPKRRGSGRGRAKTGEKQQ